MSYDQKQLGAILKACVRCLKFRFFTNHAETVCQDCREQAAK